MASQLFYLQEEDRRQAERIECCSLFAVVKTHILMRQRAVEMNCTRYAASLQMKVWHWGKDHICVPTMEHTLGFLGFSGTLKP